MTAPPPRGRSLLAVRPGMVIPLAGAASFLALTWLGRIFATEPLGFPTFWPAIGIALGLFITRPLKRWPIHALLLAILSLADGFFRGVGLRSIAAWAAGATIGPMLGAALFRASESRHTKLDRVHVLAPLLLAILPSALISGGFIALASPGVLRGSALFERWLPWAAAAALGALTIVPLLLTRWSRRHWPETGRARLVEAVIAVSLLVAEVAIFLGPLESLRRQTPIFEFLFVPILIWIPLRLGVPGTVLSNALQTGLAAYWAKQGTGPFALTPGSHESHLVELQAIGLAFTTLTLALALAAHEWRAARASLRQSEERFRRLSEHAPIGIFHVDLAGRGLYANHRWIDLLGVSPTESREVAWFETVHVDDQPRVREEWTAAVLRHSEFHTSCRLRERHGTNLWIEARAVPTIDENGEIRTYIGTVEDVTARREVEHRLVQMALHDPLTHLANRVLLRDRLTQAVARLERERSMVAVLYLDLDFFKKINDEHGHDIGDRLLVEVGQRLVRTSRPTDTVGRIGGDEFVILCPGLRDAEEAARIARRFEAALGHPIVIDGKTMRVGGSIGIRLVDSSGVAPDDLIRDADAAMYVAKRNGRGRSELSPRIDSPRALNLERHLAAEEGRAIAEEPLPKPPEEQPKEKPRPSRSERPRRA
ncbi:MAG: diguanylate cyclase [Candidatus Eisenbacteria bacterium]